MVTLNAATDGFLARSERPPLPALLRPLLDWFEERHIELMAAAGFADVRRAHNAVFVNLPAAGARLTTLADHAQITKQAMGELVDDLVDAGYVRRIGDPSDGRAKLIVWDERGMAAHTATVHAFSTIEDELATKVGSETLDALMALLLEAVSAVRDTA